MNRAAAAGPSSSASSPFRNVLPSGLTKLLWDLRDAYEESTGETVRVGLLLSDRTAFAEFLVEASRCREDRVTNAIARIRAVAPDLLAQADAAPPPARSTGDPEPVPTPSAAALRETPSPEQIRAEHRALLERLRAPAASILPALPPAGSTNAPEPASALPLIPFGHRRSMAALLAAVLVALVAARYVLGNSKLQSRVAPVASPAAAPPSVPDPDPSLTRRAR